MGLSVVALVAYKLATVEKGSNKLITLRSEKRSWVRRALRHWKSNHVTKSWEAEVI